MWWNGYGLTPEEADVLFVVAFLLGGFAGAGAVAYLVA